jgi:thiamine pyrophosphokinase
VQERSAAATDGLPLAFQTPVAIVGGGYVDAEVLQDMARRGVALIGADGGGDVIGAAGLTPEAIIGDLDSLEDPAAWRSRTQVLPVTEQITTDFEKCVYSTKAPVTIALGMTGKRFDHTMAALHVVMRYAGARAIILVDEHDIALGVRGAFDFTAIAGERVSMHPLEPVRFARSSGLRYPLDGLTLAPGVLTGVSNEGTGGTFAAEPAAGENGAWLLILDKSRLWDLVETVMSRGQV